MSGLIVTLRTFGEYALRVNDPTKLILNLVGTVDVTNNQAITGWVTQQLLKVTRTTVTTQLMSGAWPILGLSMHSPEIEAQSLDAANQELADYGISLTRLGNVDVNLDDEDNARLKKLAGDTAYSRLAGGFLQAAQAEALQGAGQGMAQGGGAVTPMFFGAGMGMAGNMMQAPAQAPYNPPPGPGFAGSGQGYAQQAASQPAPRSRRRKRPPAGRPSAPAGGAAARPWRAPTARARSPWARSSAPSAARPRRSIAPTATPASAPPRSSALSAGRRQPRLPHRYRPDRRPPLRSQPQFPAVPPLLAVPRCL